VVPTYAYAYIYVNYNKVKDM